MRYEQLSPCDMIDSTFDFQLSPYRSYVIHSKPIYNHDRNANMDVRISTPFMRCALAVYAGWNACMMHTQPTRFKSHNIIHTVITMDRTQASDQGNGNDRPDIKEFL